MTIRFAKIDEFDGAGIYASPTVTDTGGQLRAWRFEPGVWGWSIAWPSGHELPADCTYRTRHDAQRAAAAWWTENGQAGLDHVRVRHLGEWTRFLANTSDRTRKTTAATIRAARLARQAEQASAELEAPIGASTEHQAPGLDLRAELAALLRAAELVVGSLPTDRTFVGRMLAHRAARDRARAILAEGIHT